jgi:hypothetical protein
VRSSGLPFTRVHVQTAEAVLRRLRTFGSSFIFRGHMDMTWTLSSSLTRIGHISPKTLEDQMLAHFPRRAAEYLPFQQLPKGASTLRWLSLLQHYGAPTRLLDCTRSPYVALFFAIETTPVRPSAAAPAVWIVDAAQLKQALLNAVDSRTLKLTDDDDMPIDGSYALQVAGTRDDLVAHDVIHTRPATPIVVVLEPWQIDARQAAQQSVFLCQGDLTQPLTQNMECSGVDLKRTLTRLSFPWTCRPALLAELRRMNVTSEALFPGLDGYARSFRTRFEEPLP